MTDIAKLDKRLAKGWMDVDNNIECLSYSFGTLSKAFRKMKEINDNCEDLE